MSDIRGGGRSSLHVWRLILWGALLGCVACGQPELQAETPLTTAHSRHVAIPLPSGNVLVAAGLGTTAPVLTAPAEFVNTPTPTIAGTAEPDSTVTVSLDGTPVGTATANDLGVWSLVVGSPLYEGSYTATAISVDGAGNTSPPSEPRGFTVDTTAPGAPVITAPGDFTTTFTPLISGTAEPGSTVAVKVDGTTVRTVTADASGNWSASTPPLPDGAYTATAITTDAAGNTSLSSAPRTFTVDTQLPVNAVFLAPAAFVNTTTPVISGTAEPGSRVEVKEVWISLGVVIADASGNWSITSGTPLGHGVHNLMAWVTDRASNTNPYATHTFTVDIVAPVAPVLSAPAALVTTSMPVISGTAEVGGMVEVKVDGISVGTVPVDNSGSWTLTAALGDGAHAVTATVTDHAGNTSEASTARTFTVDTVEQETQGCACASSAAGGMAPPLGLLALWFWSRRRLSWL